MGISPEAGQGPCSLYGVLKGRVGCYPALQGTSAKHRVLKSTAGVVPRLPPSPPSPASRPSPGPPRRASATASPARCAWRRRRATRCAEEAASRRVASHRSRRALRWHPDRRRRVCATLAQRPAWAALTIARQWPVLRVGLFVIMIINDNNTNSNLLIIALSRGRLFVLRVGRRKCGANARSARTCVNALRTSCTIRCARCARLATSA